MLRAMARSKLLLTWLLAVLLVSCGPTTTTQPAPATQPTVGDGTDTTTPPPSVDEILASSDLPEPLPEPLPGDKLGVTIHRLSNGMTVYLSTDRSKPRFNAWIAVRAGSRHDPPDSTGLAHYLEHMMFKGTDEIGTLDIEKERPHLQRIAALYDELRKTEDPARRKEIFAEIDKETIASAQYSIPNELDQLYARMGVTGLNAFTWHDMTVYVADVPSNRFEAWAQLEAERFRDPEFRLFYPELEAVYEEKNMSLDSPRERVDDALMLALFPKHPYGTQPTIGTVDHLKTPAYADMVDYYHRWYVPNNIAIVIAGDVDPSVLPALEKAFGDWQPKKLEAPAEAWIVPVEGRTERVVQAEGEESVTLGWQLVSITHEDQVALEVMDALLANQSAGILDIDLVLSGKLPRAGASPSFMTETGWWEVYGIAREGQSHDEVEQLLLGVLEKLKRGEFTQEDIDAIVVQEEIQEQTELESNSSRVGKMAAAFWNHQAWADAATRAERLRKVTKDDVVRVANKYVTGNYVVVKRVKGKHTPPKIDKPTITPVPIDPTRASAFSNKIVAWPAKEIAPEWLVEGEHYTRAKLPAGELLAAPNTINDLYSVEYVFELGRRREPLLCFALELLEKSGTATMSAEELQATKWRTGTSIQFSCGIDQLTITVSGLDRNMEGGLKLLDDWLRTAKLDPATLATLVDNTISQRKDWMEEPRVISGALAGFALNGKDSWYLLTPSNAQLKKAKVAALGKLLAKLPDHQHETRYFGPRSADDAAKVVAFGTKHKKLKPRAPKKYRSTKGKTQIFFIHKETAQSQITIFAPKAPLTEAERAIVELYNDFLGGGMGGLIFQEMREARGLAYSAWASYLDGDRPKDQSGLYGAIGTQTDKTIDALTMMLQLMRATPSQPERFAKTKEQVDQGYRASRVSPRYITGWVASWDDLGLKSDPRPERWKAVAATDEAAMMSFATRFAEGDLIIAVMGDRNRIDMAALAKLGTVTEMKVEQLFGY